MNYPQIIYSNAETINDAMCSLLITGDRTAFESLPQETLMDMPPDQRALTGFFQSCLPA